eukprot:9829427-Ditylum_brightwellii.AAC.1
MNKQNTDYMGFMAIHLDKWCRTVTRIICGTTHSNLSHCKVNTASSCTPVKHFFKSGGTMSITQGDIVSMIIESGSDEHGRLVYTKFASSDEYVVMVITAYQPCKVSKKRGMTTLQQEVVQP